MNDQERLEMTAANCEVLRSRLEKYEDSDGNPISTMAEQAREIERLSDRNCKVEDELARTLDYRALWVDVSKELAALKAELEAKNGK